MLLLSFSLPRPALFWFSSTKYWTPNPHGTGMHPPPPQKKFLMKGPLPPTYRCSSWRRPWDLPQTLTTPVSMYGRKELTTTTKIRSFTSTGYYWEINLVAKSLIRSNLNYKICILIMIFGGDKFFCWLDNCLSSKYSLTYNSVKCFC